jgi:hypothetical protein
VGLSHELAAVHRRGCGELDATTCFSRGASTRLLVNHEPTIPHPPILPGEGQILALASLVSIPEFPVGARRNEFPFSFKHAQTQARCVFGLLLLGVRPNPLLNSDPACITFRSLSASRFLGSAHRLGAGGAGYLPSLGC